MDWFVDSLVLLSCKTIERRVAAPGAQAARTYFSYFFLSWLVLMTNMTVITNLTGVRRFTVIPVFAF